MKNFLFFLCCYLIIPTFLWVWLIDMPLAEGLDRVYWSAFGAVAWIIYNRVNRWLDT